MIRGTTPTFTLRVRGDNALNLTRATNVYFTITQPGVEITISGADLEIEAQVVKAWLPQDDSLKLTKGRAEIQLNWTYSDGVKIRRNATVSKTISIGKQLLDRVI